MEDHKTTITKEKKTFMIISLIFVFALILGISFAYFMAQGQSAEQTITTAKLTLNFEEGNIIRATDISPIDDSQIKTEATELPFSITNTGDQHMNLTIKLTDITLPDALKNVDFRWGLYNADTNKGVSFGIFKYTTTEEVLLQDVILDQGSVAKNYILRVWIHDTGSLQETMMGQEFKAKVTVTGDIVEYTDESCFTFDSSTGTITGYKTDTCPTQNVDMVIPKTIDGVTVTKIDNAFVDDDINHLGISLNSIIFPDTITTISDSAIYDDNNDNLSHITIPESVTTLGNNDASTGTIFNTAIKSITIPESIINIYDPLNGSISTPIIISISNLEQYLFMGAQSDIILMEGVSSIGYRTFGVCGVSAVEIPSSVTTIASGAFDSCSNLTEIVVRGKSSLADFTDSSGLSELSGVTIKFPDA